MCSKSPLARTTEFGTRYGGNAAITGIRASLSETWLLCVGLRGASEAQDVDDDQCRAGVRRGGRSARIVLLLLHQTGESPTPPAAAAAVAHAVFHVSRRARIHQRYREL